MFFYVGYGTVLWFVVDFYRLRGIEGDGRQDDGNYLDPVTVEAVWPSERVFLKSIVLSLFGFVFILLILFVKRF